MGTNVLTQGDDAGRFGKCCEHGMTTVRNKIQQSQREPRPLTDALWKWQHGQLLSFLYSCPFHLLDFFNFFFNSSDCFLCCLNHTEKGHFEYCFKKNLI